MLYLKPHERADSDRLTPNELFGPPTVLSVSPATSSDPLDEGAGASRSRRVDAPFLRAVGVEHPCTVARGFVCFPAGQFKPTVNYTLSDVAMVSVLVERWSSRTRYRNESREWEVAIRSVRYAHDCIAIDPRQPIAIPLIASEEVSHGGEMKVISPRAQCIFRVIWRRRRVLRKVARRRIHCMYRRRT